MAKIRNSSVDNAYGGGKQQIYTDDNGKEYIIKNSSLDNVYGRGKQKIVEEKGSSDGGLAGMLFDLLPNFIKVPIYIILVGIVLYFGWELLSGMLGFLPLIFEF